MATEIATYNCFSSSDDNTARKNWVDFSKEYNGLDIVHTKSPKTTRRNYAASQNIVNFIFISTVSPALFCHVTH